ncbi:MAG TPA: BrnT family toxin [Dehalococcoidia bacterium]|nr:BrnT family toxin [Dehalococcoidia bacterium]
MPQFDWDDGNRDKNLRHGVQDWAIEEAFSDPRAILAGARRAGMERRRTILARVPGKYLRISYAVRVSANGRLSRPISAMLMTAAERARYQR